MFDVSALLSLKPAAPVTDQPMIPGMEALQTSSFSQVLSTQLEVLPVTPAVPDAVLPELATLTVALDPAGKRQSGGKILPDALPETLPVAPEGVEAEVVTQDAIRINPLNQILANRVELTATPSLAKAGRKETAAPEAETPQPETAEALPAAPAPVAITIDQPAMVMALVAPLVPVTLPVVEAAAPSRIATPQAVAPEGKPTATVTPATVAAVIPAPTAVPASPMVVSAAALAAITVPQPAVTEPLPGIAKAPVAVSTIALVAAQAQQAPVEAQPTAAPAVAPQPAAAAQIAATLPGAIPGAIASAKLAPAQPAEPVVTADAAVAAEVVAPTIERPAAAKPQTPRAQARTAAREAEAVASPAAPAAAAAPTTPASERAAPVSAAVAPATIATDLRQPVVGPAAAATITPTEAPQDFAALVDRLVAARETAKPVQASISHAEFGRVSLDFRQDGGDLTVGMKSADPGFAPAVMAAMAASDFVKADKSSPAPDFQPQNPSQIQAAQQAQAGTQAQNQNQPQPQSQQQQPSQQSGGNSAQLHQDASGQRGADGSGAQGRGGQERSGRYQSNPSPSGRDNDSSQMRRGTYA